MKNFKFNKEKVKMVVVGTFLFGAIFSTSALASTNDIKLKTTEEFENWNNLTQKEKSQILMPETFSVKMPESILREYEVEGIPDMRQSLLGGSSFIADLDYVSASATSSRFNLAEALKMRVEHQGTTSECWAFSILKSMETNIALNSGNRALSDFSERHMDYATSKTFSDGINKDAFSRETGNGGLPIAGLAYLTNGQGAVLEEDMPFVDDDKKEISLKEIDKEVNTVVTDYTIFPGINKTYQKDGSGNTISVKYYDAYNQEYTDAELRTVRKAIKEHLVKEGAITTMTGGNYAQYYNNPSIFKATAYNCNDINAKRDHAITIVGWDDNYSRNNFAEGARPSSDGAYIVLNSYGKDSFDKGYIYVSYEDNFIEKELYGIESTSKVDYDNIYQYDFYGSVFSIGTDSISTGYFGNYYERDASKKEMLESVGVTIASYASVEIYVNPSDRTMQTDKLIKVGKSDGVLTPGYHRIDITPTELTSDKFAIVVKQKSEDGTFYISTEICVDGSAYANVDSENKSYMSMDGVTWTNISTLKISDVNMKKSDVCIKAFTTDIEEPEPEPEPEQKPEEVPEEEPEDKPVEQPEDKPQEPEKEPEQKPVEPEPEPEPEPEKIVLESDEYTITEDGYIMNIDYNTTIKEFYELIRTDFLPTMVEEGLEQEDENALVKTGMVLKLSEGSKYTLIVKGDMNQDGKVSLIDVSKLLLHYNEQKGYELTGAPEKAADMNVDGRVSLIDLSRIITLYNSI